MNQYAIDICRRRWASNKHGVSSGPESRVAICLMEVTDVPVSAIAKFAPVMPAFGTKEIRSRIAAHRFRKVVNILIAGLCPDRFCEYLRNVAA